MDECKHMHVQSWTFQDGESARLWSCSACGRKFVPLDVQQEKDAKRYRRLRDGKNWPAAFARHDAPEPLLGVDLDKAIDDVMSAGDIHG